MVTHKFHYTSNHSIDVMEWLLSLGMAFMSGYTLAQGPRDTEEEIIAQYAAGLWPRAPTICFSTENDNLAVMFKLKWSDILVDLRQYA